MHVRLQTERIIQVGGQQQLETGWHALLPLPPILGLTLRGLSGHRT